MTEMEPATAEFAFGPPLFPSEFSMKRNGGYVGYWRARERLLLESARPLDALDASSLRPGRLERVEVREVRGDVAVLVGSAGRRAVVPRAGFRLGARGSVLVEYDRKPVELLRTAEGSIVAVRDAEVLGEYASPSEARAAHSPPKLIVREWRPEGGTPVRPAEADPTRGSVDPRARPSRRPPWIRRPA